MKITSGKFFILIALLVIGFAYYDYQKAGREESDKLVANRIFPNRISEDVVSFKIHSIFGDVAVEKKDDKWQVTAPVADAADTLTVTTYLNTLLNQEMKKVETEAAVDWAQYGLDKPDGWVEVTFQDRHRSMIQVGTVRAIADGHYLRQDSGNALYVGSAEWTGLVNRPPGEFRDKSMFEPDPRDPIREFTIRQKKNDLRVVKSEKGWKVVSGEGVLDPEKFETDPTKVSDFVTVVGNFKVDLVVADNKSDLKGLALEKPYLEFSVKNEKDERTVSFSRGKNGKVYALSSAREAVFEVSADKVGTLSKTAKDFEAVPRDKDKKAALNKEEGHEPEPQKKATE